MEIGFGRLSAVHRVQYGTAPDRPGKLLARMDPQRHTTALAQYITGETAAGSDNFPGSPFLFLSQAEAGVLAGLDLLTGQADRSLVEIRIY